MQTSSERPMRKQEKTTREVRKPEDFSHVLQKNADKAKNIVNKYHDSISHEDYLNLTSKVYLNRLSKEQINEQIAKLSEYKNEIEDIFTDLDRFEEKNYRNFEYDLKQAKFVSASINHLLYALYETLKSKGEETGEARILQARQEVATTENENIQEGKATAQIRVGRLGNEVMREVALETRREEVGSPTDRAEAPTFQDIGLGARNERIEGVKKIREDIVEIVDYLTVYFSSVDYKPLGLQGIKNQIGALDAYKKNIERNLSSLPPKGTSDDKVFEGLIEGLSVKFEVILRRIVNIQADLKEYETAFANIKRIKDPKEQEKMKQLEKISKDKGLQKYRDVIDLANKKLNENIANKELTILVKGIIKDYREYLNYLSSVEDMDKAGVSVQKKQPKKLFGGLMRGFRADKEIKKLEAIETLLYTY